MQTNKKILISGLVLCLLFFSIGILIEPEKIETTSQTNTKLGFDVHVTAEIKRKGETEFTFLSHHVAVFTTIGKNEVENELGDSGHSHHTMNYISLSSSASSPSAVWTQLPSEIVSNGFERALGVYASTGDGAWTIIYTFTATGTLTDVQRVGLNWAVSGDNNLAFADSITTNTYNSGDTLKITWSLSAS